MRKTLRKPSAQKAAPRKRKLFARTREEFSLHFWVDVTTLVASIATVVTLVLLLKDRPAQANVAAWTLLQNYLTGDHDRPHFNEGQGFALETLAHNHIDLWNIDANRIYLANTNLHNASMQESEFSDATFSVVDFSGADLDNANFEHAFFAQCNCRHVDFSAANLRKATLAGGDYRAASFSGADISDMTIHGAIQLDAGAFLDACYREGHPPHFYLSAAKTHEIHPNIAMPKRPLGVACDEWRDAWVFLWKNEPHEENVRQTGEGHAEIPSSAVSRGR